MGDLTFLRGETLSPTDIELMVSGASILDLIRYLPAKSVDEVEMWDAIRAMYGPDRFACPRCQLTPCRRYVDRLGATVVDSVFWRCEICSAWGTRWELARIILEDAEALSDFLAGEVSRAS